jgi:hypothetical protein
LPGFGGVPPAQIAGIVMEKARLQQRLAALDAQEESLTARYEEMAWQTDDRQPPAGTLELIKDHAGQIRVSLKSAKQPAKRSRKRMEVGDGEH